MRNLKTGVFLSALFLVNFSIASLVRGLSFPASETMASFLPPAPKGWEEAPAPNTVFDIPGTGSIIQQTYEDPSGRTIAVMVQALIPRTTQTETGGEEVPQCRYDSKEYDIQGFRVYDMIFQCPDSSGHTLYTALLDSKDLLLSVSAYEEGAVPDDGTLKALIESMDLKGLRGLVG